MGMGLAPAKPASQPGELQLSRSLHFCLRSSPSLTLPLHFLLAQVTGLQAPTGCPLVLAPTSDGTKMSMVAIETRHTGHKIQKPHRPSSPSPSKVIIVQLQGPSPRTDVSVVGAPGRRAAPGNSGGVGSGGETGFS